MSYWWGGGYPRGNPPNWDEETETAEEKKEETALIKENGIGCFAKIIGVLLIIGFVIGAIFLTKYSLSRRQSMQGESKIDKAPCDYTVVSAGPSFSNFLFLRGGPPPRGETKVADKIYVQHVVVKKNITTDELWLLVKYLLRQDIDYPYNRNRVIRIGLNADALQEAEYREERSSYTRDKRAAENYEKCYLLKVVKYDFSFREVQWCQKKGKFSDFYGTVKSF